jgi:hypothetical protein
LSTHLTQGGPQVFRVSQEKIHLSRVIDSSFQM